MQQNATGLRFPTAPTAFRRIGLRGGESLKGERGTNQSGLLGLGVNPRKPTRGASKAGGTIPQPLGWQSGPLLAGCMGDVTTSSLGSGYYQHLMKLKASLPTYTMEKGFPDINAYFTFLGCMFGGFSLKAKDEGEQDVDFDVTGLAQVATLNYKSQTGTFTAGLVVTGGTSGAKGRVVYDYDGGTVGILLLTDISGAFQDAEAITDTSTGAAAVDGTLNSKPIDASLTDPGHDSFDGFSIASIQEGGSDIAIVTDASFSMKRTLTARQVLGGKGIARNVSPGSAVIEGTINVLFETMDLFMKALKFQESSFSLTYQNGTGVGTAGNESLNFLMQEIVFDESTPVIESDEGIIYEGPFKGYYADGAAGSALQITLKCTDATVLTS
jgi:hypothetical protein